MSSEGNFSRIAEAREQQGNVGTIEMISTSRDWYDIYAEMARMSTRPDLLQNPMSESPLRCTLSDFYHALQSHVLLGAKDFTTSVGIDERLILRDSGTPHQCSHCDRSARHCFIEYHTKRAQARNAYMQSYASPRRQNTVISSKP